MTTNTPMDALKELRLRAHENLGVLADELSGDPGIDDDNIVFAIIDDLLRHANRLVVEQIPAIAGMDIETPADEPIAARRWTRLYDDGTPIRADVSPRNDVMITRWTRDPHPEHTDALIAEYSRPALVAVDREDR